MNLSEPPPRIPKEEYPQRWKRVQTMMEERGLDLLLAYADDRAVFGPAHARWLADFPVHFEPVCILLAREGEPVLLCGPESDEYALLVGQLSDVRILEEFTHPDEDYPFTQIQSFREVVNERFGLQHSVTRVGLAGRGLMAADTLAKFQDAMSDAEWIDVESAMCSLRAIKTPAEVEVIRYAYRIAEEGLQAAVAAIEEGATERGIAAEAEAAMRRAGAEGTGIDTIVASGPNSRPILGRSTFRRIQADEHVLLTVAPRYEGYHGAIGRPVLIGSPTSEIQHALDVAAKAQEKCFEALGVGIEGRTVEALGREVLEEAELGSYFLYSGVHSVGVIEFEPPIFGPSNDTILEEGMVISIDIPIFNAPWGGLRVEDGYLLTGEGVERLDSIPYRLKK